MWNPFPATYLAGRDGRPFSSLTQFATRDRERGKLLLVNELYRNWTYFFPMAKATTVEWFRVKKYFFPAPSFQSSFSDRCSNPSAFRRLLDSSTQKHQYKPNNTNKSTLKWCQWIGNKSGILRYRHKVTIPTDGVESSRRGVEKVDQLESHGGGPVVRHENDAFSSPWPAGAFRTTTTWSRSSLPSHPLLLHIKTSSPYILGMHSTNALSEYAFPRRERGKQF